MNPLIKDLETPKQSLDAFVDVTKRVLGYLPSIISGSHEVRGYTLFSSEVSGIKKFVRPIRNDFFFSEAERFQSEAEKFIQILDKIRDGRKTVSGQTNQVIDSVTYTIQQSIGVGLDLLSNPNSARKHVGNRFEELIRLIVTRLGISNKKIVFKIPYPTDEGEKMYSCETDMILSPLMEVKSDAKNIDEREVSISWIHRPRQNKPLIAITFFPSRNS